MPTPAPTLARQLAAVPPSQFVAERDRLASALARSGDRAGAAGLKKLRKPTRAVWALNQLAREDEASCRALFAASDELLSVQQSAGGDVAAFREALSRQRGLFEALLGQAKRLLAEARETADEATLTRVTRGLRAAAAGGEVREALLEGALLEEPEEPGFFPFGAAPSPSSPTSPTSPAATRGEHSSRPAPARAEHAPSSRDEVRRAKLRAARDEAKRLARSAATELEAAEATRDEAQKEEARAREARESAVAEVERLRAALAATETKAKELGAAWGKRHRALVEATAAWEAARARAGRLDSALAEAEADFAARP